MFGRPKPAPIADPHLGTLAHSRGFWRGEIVLETGGPAVPLALAGSRRAPDDEALAAARDLPRSWPSLRPALASELYAHYEPYAGSEAHVPEITAPDEVWHHVSLAAVSVLELSGELVAEIACTAAWDEEHTLGARLRGGTVAELCGSVLVP